LKTLLNSTCLAALLALSIGSAHAQAVDPDENPDVLERAKAKGKLIACADPYDYPYAAQNSNPPGFDVEIMEAMVAKEGMRLEIYWADTSTRGGMSRALRNSILKGRCDVFMGVSESGDDDQLMGRLTFTDGYLGLGYVLVTQGKAAGMKTLQQLKDANIKIGVAMSTPIDDYLFTNGVPRDLHLDNRRIMQAMADGKIDAAIVWATAIGVAQREYPDRKFKMVEGYVPPESQRWNLKHVVRKEDKSLIEFLNKGTKELLANGKMAQIVEKYGVPFYPPFPQ
jgi:ABC-type amino acid transport substrate-binding protein